MNLRNHCTEKAGKEKNETQVHVLPWTALMHPDTAWLKPRHGEKMHQAKPTKKRRYGYVSNTQKRLDATKHYSDTDLSWSYDINYIYYYMQLMTIIQQIHKDWKTYKKNIIYHTSQYLIDKTDNWIVRGGEVWCWIV